MAPLAVKLYSDAVRELINVLTKFPSLIIGKISGAISPNSLNLGTVPLLKFSCRENWGDNVCPCCNFSKELSPRLKEDSLIAPQDNILIKSATAAGAK